LMKYLVDVEKLGSRPRFWSLRGVVRVPIV
jgi:hypothetical protein